MANLDRDAVAAHRSARVRPRDTQTERAIAQERERISRGRAALVIAHRLSTIAGADTILVMERDRVVERGTHAELLQRRGVYALMWVLQRRSRRWRRARRV